MNNPDNLIGKIIKDAESEVNDILQNANKIKEEIIAKKSMKANKKVMNIVQRAEREASRLQEQIISSAHIKARDEQLKAKGEMIERVFREALEKLTKLEEQEYFHFLKNQLKNMKLRGSEILVVPENRRDMVKNLDLPIKLSDEEVVDSGFMLIDEQFIINHTFTSVLDFYRDELEVEVARVLFND